MAVPAHDERDFAFAKKFGLPIIQVVAPANGPAAKSGEAFTGEGIAVNSGPIDGLATAEAKKAVIHDLEARGAGKGAVSYRLRDWVFSRQRYWGEPIPLVHCDKDGVVAVPESQLPVRLPDVESYAPTGTGESPLAGIESFVNTTCPKCGGPARRETNTMPQWAGSCWYYLRYLSPKDDARAVRPDGREGMDVRRPVRGRRRARRAAPAVRALLAQVPVRPGPGAHRRAVPEAAPPGDRAGVFVPGQPGPLSRAERDRVPRRDRHPDGHRRDAEQQRREDGQVQAERRQPRRRRPRLRRRRHAPVRVVHGRVRAAQALGPARHRGGEPVPEARLAAVRRVGRRARARRRPARADAPQDHQARHQRPRADGLQHRHRRPDGVPERAERAAAPRTRTW